MTYEESSALMNDFQFRGRIKVAALKYADYIMNEANNVQGHNSRENWARRTWQMPEQVATELHPPVVMDANVQSAGAAIDDAALQTAVESVVNKIV
jgi:hypothetical protein